MWINGQTYIIIFMFFLLFSSIFANFSTIIFIDFLFYLHILSLFIFHKLVYWYFLKAGSRIYAFLCLCVDVLKHIYMGEYINIHRQVVSSIRQFGTFSRAGALFTCAYTCVIGSLIPLFMYFSRLFLVLSWFPF